MPKGVFIPVEAPKGEFGVFIVSDGTNQPYRVKLESSWICTLIRDGKNNKGPSASRCFSNFGFIRYCIWGDR